MSHLSLKVHAHSCAQVSLENDAQKETEKRYSRVLLYKFLCFFLNDRNRRPCSTGERGVGKKEA